MNTFDVEVAVAAGDMLGESCAWSATARRLYWVDGSNALVHSLDPATGNHKTMAIAGVTALGMIAVTCHAAELAVATDAGVGMLDLVSGAVTIRANPEAGRSGIGWNDGKIDSDGCLWVGTCDVTEREPRGSVWMFEDWDRPRLVETGAPVWNGPAFSPDNRTLYLSDSVGRRILAYDKARHAPWLTNARVFASLTEAEGLPDGLTTDADGGVWCAHWDGARVTRFSPEGVRLIAIPMPAQRITSVAFGGTDLATLYVTSARYDLSGDAPGAGHLFAVQPGVAGVAATATCFMGSNL